MKQFFTQIEGTADAAFAVDDAGRISAWNRPAADLFGLSEAEVLGVDCHQVLQCSDDNEVVCREHCIVGSAAQDQLPRTNFDLRVQTKTGKLWCNLSSLIANDASGACHAIHIVRPREMRKRFEQALREFVRLQESLTGALPTSTRTPAPNIGMSLTAREMEVLKRLGKGCSTRTMAAQLNISSATVNNHIKHILTKLEAHTRLEAIRRAEEAGLI